MKKSTIELMLKVLDGQQVDVTALREELELELTQRADSNEARKVKKAEARADLLTTALPAVLEMLADKGTPATAKELFEQYAPALEAAGVKSAQSLQYILIHDLADKVKVTANGRKAKQYSLM